MAYYGVPLQKNMLDFCWTFGNYDVPRAHIIPNIFYLNFEFQSVNNTRFLSIISSILSI